MVSPDKSKRLRELGAYIRTMRERRGWSQRDLEAYSGVAQPNIAQIENGLRDPSATTLLMLADAFQEDLVLIHKKEKGQG